MVNYLDSEEIEQLLQSARVGRLGCVVIGRWIYVVVANILIGFAPIQSSERFASPHCDCC